MKEILGIFMFFYYSQMEMCKAEKIPKAGLCMVNYTEQVSVQETYIHEYTVSELQLCSTGRYPKRYYNCYRDVKKKETRTKTVPKSVQRTRIECCAGYKNTTVLEKVFICEPICDPPCIEGDCSTPGNCTCFHGYEHQDSNKCIPSCKPDCLNGFCTKPGHCECKEGYDKVNGSYCEPHCSHKCNNGICYKPEECLCNTGYKKIANNAFDCEPMCDVPCINATCTSYNECTCLEGFRKSPTQSNICKPICELECLNGDCTAPNTCTCYKGYSKNGSLNICEPDCAYCFNGFCSKPNVCNCNENYTSNDHGICEPICNNCNNGICITPYECDCIEGYHLDKDKCIPYCDSCENGECIGPNVCSCFEGYENSTGSCMPFCKYGCFAGVCVGPNNCSCEETGRIEENICFPLQQNETNSTENITPIKFSIDIMKIPDSIDDYYLYLSKIYMKVNCSYEEIYNTSYSSERNSYSIECSNIKNALGLYVLCLWNRFSSDIQDIYTEFLPSIIYEFNETEMEKHFTKLGMTVLLPTDMIPEEEVCYLCPSWKHLRTKMPSGNITIPLIPCQLKKFQNPLMSFFWKAIGIVAVAVLVALAAIILGFVLYFRKRPGRHYFVRSSVHTDQIALSLNQEN
ncbi:protein draper isoform X1 [Halyomorpha halys]|uniref:protein draper isoform X1 n=1 Tax=Halyomorpha halys TaxID=286706 RepID=UPI0006D4E9FC|nr:cell death abnormality protein 1-like isoform X1 [Halyomorpha halys]